jgi:hypothetical protein
MSTLGMAARSMRAPAIPSATQRPLTGSTKKHASFIDRISTGGVQVLPPLKDLIMVCVPIPGVPTAKWVKNAYTTPWLSVRTVHP